MTWRLLVCGNLFTGSLSSFLIDRDLYINNKYVAGKETVKRYMMSKKNLENKHYETIITSQFVHFSYNHIFLNTAALWSLSYVLAPSMGLKKYFAVYFISGSLASTIPAFFFVDSHIAGSSGGIFGLLAATSFFSKIKLPFMMATAIDFASGNNYGHVIGYVAGFITSAILKKKLKIIRI